MVKLVKLRVAVMGIIYRYRYGRLEILLQDSCSLLEQYEYQGVQTKNPGGKVEDLDKDFLAALDRELREEVYLHLKDGVKPTPVYDHIKGAQRKIFYPIQDKNLDGVLRTEEIDDNDSHLFPPYWVELTSELIETKVYKTHRPALRRFYRDYSFN